MSSTKIVSSSSDTDSEPVSPSSPTALQSSRIFFSQSPHLLRPGVVLNKPVSKPALARSRSKIDSEFVKSSESSVEGGLQMSNVIEDTCDVMCVRYSPNGSLLAVGLADGSIKIYSSDSGQCLHALICDDMTAIKLPVTSIRFHQPSSNGDKPTEHRSILYATYASGHVRCWHYSSGTCLLATNEQRGQTLLLAFNSLGDRYATVGSDPQVFIYDAETRKRVSVLDATDSRDKMDGHRARVFAVLYHPRESHVLLSGGWDDTVQYWDDRQPHSTRKFFGPHICGDALDIDAVRNHILTGSWRKEASLQVWDFGSAKIIADIPQDLQIGSQLYCAQWLGKDKIACGGSFNNMARVIDCNGYQTVGQFINLPQAVYCLDNDRVSPKPRIAVGTSSKVYQLKTRVLSSAVGYGK